MIAKVVARVEPMAMITAGVLNSEATVPTMYERLRVTKPWEADRN